jgi:hypothetical protein
MLVFASVYSTTWDECVDMYDIFTCAQLEEATAKSLFMWYGCLAISKETRERDAHGIEPLARKTNHDFLVLESNSNHWIRRGFTSARYFRSDQVKVNDWIPRDSPYWD